jgi:hypothetical protein
MYEQMDIFGENRPDTCLWASEIEEFPMAVTKLRIGE